MQNRTFALILAVLLIIYPPSIGVTTSQSDNRRVKPDRFLRREPSGADSILLLINKERIKLSKAQETLKKQQDTIKRIKQ